MSPRSFRSLGLVALSSVRGHSLPWEPLPLLMAPSSRSPEQAPLQKVSLAQNSRYYLSCPMESRHATYS